MWLSLFDVKFRSFLGFWLFLLNNCHANWGTCTCKLYGELDTDEQFWDSSVDKSMQKRRYTRNQAERVAVYTNKDLSALFEGISIRGSVLPFLWLLPETIVCISSFTSILMDSTNACRALSYATLRHRPIKIIQAWKGSSELWGLDTPILLWIWVSKLAAAVLSLLNFPLQILQMSYEVILRKQRFLPASVYERVCLPFSLSVYMYIYTHMYMYVYNIFKHMACNIVKLQGRKRQPRRE